MRIIIVGCGRVGAELALSVSHKQHEVVVVDDRQPAFDRLGAGFHGRTVLGSGIDRHVLRRAEIEGAGAFAAVTASDNVNIVAARVAKEIYRVPIVVARAYNPHRVPIYERLGLQTVTSSSWGARRIEELLTSPQCASRLSLGNGDVEIIEARVPAAWTGRQIGDLALRLPAVPVAVTRGGRAQLADSDFALQAGDLLCLAVKADNLPRVNESLGGEGRS
ncbi:MAG: TrkA family potassium uptake protein [Chloroflexi bacterium]|nr:TrkA family potassium uptake protein [Chloroflexota bacterium]